MPIAIHPFTPADLPALESLDPLLWLSMRHHGDYTPENAFCAYEGDTLLGFGTLSKTGSWYTSETRDPLRRLMLSLRTAPDLEDPDEVRGLLLDALILRVKQIAAEFPDRRVAISAFVEEDDGYLIQQLLERGFGMDTLIPVLGVDLEEPLASPAPPPEFRIASYDYESQGVAAYVEADYLASDHQVDSPNEVAFRLHGPGFETFAAFDGSRLVGACSVWEIGEGRAATENIFVLPEYRGRGIARALVLTALRELQSRGLDLATLTVEGTNREALGLYVSLGYTYRYLILEMLYMA